ncbi:hypothetical protein BHM03_00056402, partial [Ensete ventricosum]
SPMVMQRYIPFSTSDLLERYAQQSIESCKFSLGLFQMERILLLKLKVLYCKVLVGTLYIFCFFSSFDYTVESERSIQVQYAFSHARSVVVTLGGEHGAARRHDKWRYLHSGFTVWLSISEAAGNAFFYHYMFEEARRHVQDGWLAYSNADIVMKLGGWEPDQSQVVAQACLSALKRLTLSDKQLTGCNWIRLTGKKSLYVRLGCRGDWPDIKPPGWDPSSGVHPEP